MGNYQLQLTELRGRELHSMVTPIASLCRLSVSFQKMDMESFSKFGGANAKLEE